MGQRYGGHYSGSMGQEVTNMHVSIDRIKSNPEDFKVCVECGYINWYENDRCIMCGSRQFRRVHNKDIVALEQVYLDGSTEIDV